MRLEFPKRIPPAATLTFASVLFCIQQLEHTSLIFSLLFFGFVMLGNFGFNLGGGFTRVSGAYVFLFTILTCTIGVTWKAVIGEPADSNLLTPNLDMAIYCASNFMLLLVILVTRKLTSKAQGLGNANMDYTLCALGCLILGVTQSVFNSYVGAEPGGLLAIVNQIGQFYPLAMILGTIGAIRDSGGRRSVNFVSGLSMLIVLLSGAAGFSKQAMLTPLACWLVAATFMRFRLRTIHFVCLGACAIVGYSVVPLIAAGRNVAREGASYEERAAVTYQILTHLDEAKRLERETEDNVVSFQGKSGYYNEPQGFLERLSILAVDDALFDYTAKGHYEGYRPVIENYENWVPHFILPNKPVPIGGNYYAHEVGGFLADDDDSTGISFSPMGEAFHIDGWTGIFFLMPAVWLMLFVSMDYICGDLRRSPWGLFMVVFFAHAASESLLNSLIWMTGYGNVGLLFGIFFCTYFAPVIGALLYGNRTSTLIPANQAGRTSVASRRTLTVP